jgi:hypothetical protein
MNTHLQIPNDNRVFELQNWLGSMEWVNSSNDIAERTQFASMQQKFENVKYQR